MESAKQRAIYNPVRLFDDFLLHSCLYVCLKQLIFLQKIELLNRNDIEEIWAWYGGDIGL
jgi:hypothetical protein